MPFGHGFGLSLGPLAPPAPPDVIDAILLEDDTELLAESGDYLRLDEVP